jgi:hypothetical protein
MRAPEDRLSSYRKNGDHLMLPAAVQATPDPDLVASIGHEFTLASQTSAGDRLALLKIRDIFRNWPSYNYLEIGSYLGGSLVPFCRDPHCKHILSIDDRGRNQPDARGATYDYTSVTSGMMLENLARQGIPASRVEVFDGSVSEIAAADRRYDLAMIDGEHTDWACFRDFIHARNLLADNAIVMFHDSELIFNSLKMIREYLLATGTRFVFFKDRQSAISFLLLNDYAGTGMEELFAIEPSLEDFEARAARRLTQAFVFNQTLLPRRMVKLVMRRQPRSFKQS